MQLRQRGRDAERLAEQAWDNLTTTVESTGRRTRRLADKASTRMTETSEEARRRASAAMDALAGRRPRRPWNWLAGALALGTVLGWLTAVFGRKAVTQTRYALDNAPRDDMLAADMGELTSPPDMTAPRPM
jgi:ElaB/YqjD/DUF883 family membrane-anchored ribosome-binding protein